MPESNGAHKQSLLDDEKFRERFIARLVKCEKNLDKLSQYEKDFVDNMRDKWEDRQRLNNDWSPSAKQWNFLGDLWIAVQ